MDLAIQATNYNVASPIQNRAGQGLAIAQPATAPKPETSARNTQENLNLNQTRQQRQTPAPAATAQPTNLVSRNVTDYEYEGALSVMKVTDKDVLIYQVPAKGALEIIKAESEQASRIETTV